MPTGRMHGQAGDGRAGPGRRSFWWTGHVLRAQKEKGLCGDDRELCLTGGGQVNKTREADGVQPAPAGHDQTSRGAPAHPLGPSRACRQPPRRCLLLRHSPRRPPFAHLSPLALSAWFRNLWVWPWTWAQLLSLSRSLPVPVHGPELVNETGNENRKMRKIRTAWHSTGRSALPFARPPSQQDGWACGRRVTVWSSPVSAEFTGGPEGKDTSHIKQLFQ